MQMSSTELFVFVEGKESDPFFYAGVCRTVLGHALRYEVCIAEQMPGRSGGKQALLGFFCYLRRRRSLTSSLGGKRTAAIFFVDKDVDDLQRKRRRSDHVVYTEHYDVQNYIFLHGNLLMGAASAASVDPACLSADLSDASSWCLRVAGLWRQWIALCLFLMNEKISCEANYGVTSPIQSRPSASTDDMLLRDITRRIARNAGIPVAKLRKDLEAFSVKVEKYFAKGLHHRVFKGKWFAVILADEIDVAMTGRPYDRNGLARRLPSSIAATLSFSEPWCEYFRSAIQRVSLEL